MSNNIHIKEKKRESAFWVTSFHIQNQTLKVGKIFKSKKNAADFTGRKVDSYLFENV